MTHSTLRLKVGAINMNYCLFTPYLVRPASNAGWHMITAGIKYLIRQADPDAKFNSVGMFSWPKNHDFKNYDRLVLCGNPRYDLGSKEGAWLYEGLLTKMVKLGIPIIDAWQGTGCPLGGGRESNLDQLGDNQRNKNIIQILKRAKAKVITRDSLTQQLNEMYELDTILLPCSSYWAAKEYNTSVKSIRTEKIVVIYRMPGYSDIQGLLKTLSRTHRIIATSSYDSEWCESIKLKYELIYDPIELLELYSNCIEVISYRLHAAIPAASLGCNVYAGGIDTRVEACALFDIVFGDYRDGVAEPKEITTKEPLDLTNILKE